MLKLQRSEPGGYGMYTKPQKHTVWFKWVFIRQGKDTFTPNKQHPSKGIFRTRIDTRQDGLLNITPCHSVIDFGIISRWKKLAQEIQTTSTNPIMPVKQGIKQQQRDHGWKIKGMIAAWNSIVDSLRSSAKIYINFENEYYWICMVAAFGITHWGRDKMATYFPTTFRNAFSWMKIYVLQVLKY